MTRDQSSTPAGIQLELEQSDGPASSSSMGKPKQRKVLSATHEAMESSGVKTKGSLGVQRMLEILTRSVHPLKLFQKSKKIKRLKGSSGTRRTPLFLQFAHRIGAYFEGPPAIIEYSAAEVLHQIGLQIEATKVLSRNESKGETEFYRVTLIIHHSENGKLKISREEIYAKHKRVRDIMRESGVTGLAEDMYKEPIREALGKMGGE